MRLFDIDENYQVLPNKIWIGLIPELVVLLQRDKTSRKLRARKEFTYIYFFMDFGSPLRDYELADKKKEALYYAQLNPEDIDDKVEVASRKYEELQISASRSLRTYRSMMKGLDALDKHFNKVNFDETNKLGQQVHSPDKFAQNIARMNKVYDELRLFEKRVEDDLKNSDAGIRGNAILGDNEARRTNSNSNWSEEEIGNKSSQVAEGAISNANAPSFMSMEKIISKQNHLTDAQIEAATVFGEKEEE